MVRLGSLVVVSGLWSAASGARPPVVPGSPLTVEDGWLVLESPRHHKSRLSALSPDGTGWKVPAPAGVSRLYIDVGAFSLSDYWQVLLADPTVWLVAFEPNPEQYRAHPSHERLLLINCAVLGEPGWTTLHVPADNPLCSTLNPVQADVAKYSESSQEVVRSCAASGDTATAEVAVLPLKAVIDRLPDLPIHMLKADAQGMDLEAVLSAGDEVLGGGRVRYVAVEVLDVPPERRDRGFGLYGSEAPVLAEVEQELAYRGFHRELCYNIATREHADGLPEPEYDCYFLNTRHFPQARDPYRDCVGPAEAARIVNAHKQVQLRVRQARRQLLLARNATADTGKELFRYLTDVLSGREEMRLDVGAVSAPARYSVGVTIARAVLYECCFTDDEVTPVPHENWRAYAEWMVTCWHLGLLGPSVSKDSCCPQHYWRRIGHFPPKHEGGYF